MFFTKRSHYFKMLTLLLVTIQIYHLSAAPLTYDGCVSDTANSYRVGGWCFLLYRNSSWPVQVPIQSDAQKMCLPYGNLAVGVTYKMLATFTNNSIIQAGGGVLLAWVAGIRNGTNPNQGWYWNVLLPSGLYTTFRAVFSNMNWKSGQPDNYHNIERAIAVHSMGISDVDANITTYSYNMTVICQFAPRQWSYPKRGHGLFNANSDYQIGQTYTIKLECIRQCHAHPGCISFAYNPTTQDCQIYSVSPEDPRFAGNVTADSTYDWYIRDGMEY